MALKFCSFASGSSGNCYLIKKGKAALLIDAGISGKKILEGIENTGTSIEEVSSLFITHEHTDHIKSIRVLGKKIPDMAVYANKSTWFGIEEQTDHRLSDDRRRIFSTGREFEVDALSVKPFHISHDAAEPVGFSFSDGESKISIVTDTGCITDDIFEEIVDADLLVLEANHEPRILEYCRYPYALKKRILSDRGHLSNECAGRCITRLVEENPKRRNILLGHLSHENNMPDLAQMTVENILYESDIHVGGDTRLDVILRNKINRIYEV